MNPADYDVNQVVGWRTEPENRSPPALIYHYAGQGKSFDKIMSDFGIARHKTSDCRRVMEYIEEVSQERECSPGNAGVENAESYCKPPLAVC